MVNENGQKKSVPRDEKLSYRNFIQAIFDRHHEEGEDSFDLKKTEIAKLASKFRASLPDNLEDLLSSFRFRADFPNPFARTATPNGMEWIVESRGESVYRFRLVTRTRFLPQKSLVVIDVPDLTPQIVTRYALRDEQILLAKMRHNRLVDTGEC